MPGKRKEKISSVELWCAMCICLTTSALIIPIGAVSGHQSWISIIIGTAIASGYALIYTYLYDSHPGKSIVEIGELLLGNWAGKIIGLMYAWFSFQVAVYIIRDHWQFTLAVALPNTPLIIVTATVMVLVIWITYAGIEAIGRISIVFIPILTLYIIVSFVLLIPDFDIRNFLPLISNNWREILYAGIQVSILPLGGGAMFTMIFPHLNKKKGVMKLSLLAVSTSGILILVSNVVNILVLGPLAPKLTYPAYTAYSYIQVSDFLDRAEILIYTIFIAINFIEMSIFFYVGAVCIAKVLKTDNYRLFLIPLGFLVVEQSVFIVRNQAEFINLVIYTWPWYAMVFEFVIPLLLLILTAVRKIRRAE